MTESYILVFYSKLDFESNDLIYYNILKIDLINL